MMTGRLFRSVAIPAAILATAVGVHRLGPLSARLAAQAAAPSASDGCAPERRPVAHNAGGVKTNAKGRTLVPCMTYAGWRTHEPAITVTKAGTVIVLPGLGPDGRYRGALRSADQGRTWSSFEQTLPETDGRAPYDRDITIDRVTNRLFWLTPGYKNFPPDMEHRLDFSDDDGKTWTKTTAPTGVVDMKIGQGSRDHGFVFVGPPTAGLRSQLKDYPHVVYACAGNSPQVCARSVDGGRTFSKEVGLPFPRECDGPFPPLPPEVFYNTNFGLRGMVDTSGTVYVPQTPCNRAYVAISRDGGATWTNSRVVDNIVLGLGQLSIGIDAVDNLYATWAEIESRVLYLSISRDKGASWGAPMAIAAPGVGEVAVPQVVAGERGHAVIAYYGSTNSPGYPFPEKCAGLSNSCPAYAKQTWDMYVTTTYNALDARPTFWSTTLNDPRNPVLYGCAPTGEGVTRGRGFFSRDATGKEVPAPAGSGHGGTPRRGSCHSFRDYFGLSLASDGTAWVAVPNQCPGGKPVPGNPYCPSTLSGSANDQNWLLVGRLIAK